MTTIAWDGKTLAVDSGNTLGDTMLPGGCKKLWRLDLVNPKLPPDWMTFTGETQDGLAFLGWLASMETIAQPKLDESFAALVWNPRDKVLLRYECKLWPHVVEAPFYASGSGREYALAAMHLGHSAEVAVAVACEFDVWSRGPVQSSNAPPAPGPKRRGQQRSTSMKKSKGKTPPGKPGKKGC